MVHSVFHSHLCLGSCGKIAQQTIDQYKHLWRRAYIFVVVFTSTKAWVDVAVAVTGILFTMSVLWYWGTKRKVEALDSMKVLLGDLFKLTGLGDDGCVQTPLCWSVSTVDMSPHYPKACLFLGCNWAGTQMDGKLVACCQCRASCMFRLNLI